MSSLYLWQPTAEALAGWRALLATEISPGLTELRTALLAIDVTSPEELAALLWEYTRLFLGPYRLPCPPWESVYTSPTRLLMQEPHDAVQALYAEAGVALGDPNVLADHVGAELNFLAVLLDRAEGEGVDAAGAHALAARFRHQHLQNWIPRFTADLEGAAEVALYQALARTTRALVCEET